MRKAAGFTLVEMLVVVSLLGIMVALAAPNFGFLTRTNRVVAAANELQSLLDYARSEAMTRGVNVQVVAPSVTEWAGAVTVATVSSTVLGDAQTLRSYSGTGLASTGVNSTGSLASLTFRPNGTLVAAATIVLCATSDKSTLGRTLTLTLGGRVSMATFTPSSASSSGCS